MSLCWTDPWHSSVGDADVYGVPNRMVKRLEWRWWIAEAKVVDEQTIEVVWQATTDRDSWPGKLVFRQRHTEPNLKWPLPLGITPIVGGYTVIVGSGQDRTEFGFRSPTF